MNGNVDADLVVRCQHGDDAAFSHLMERHEKQMFNYFFRLTLDEDLAGKLTQELFVRVYRSIRKFRWNARFATWMIAIAHNLCCEWFRRQRGQVSLDTIPEKTYLLEPGYGERSLEEIVSRADGAERIVQALRGLNEEERQVVLLRHYHDLSGREIAAIMGCKEGTVWSRLHYALLKLRGLLRAEGVSDETR